ncbi:hypothetical protein JYB55_05600 [Mycolicibacterium septicum]|nr:hypothetical protein [Mycolicibacterium septicum]
MALIRCSGLLGDVICHTIAAEPDLDIVVELAAPPSDLDIAELRADIVVWNEADPRRIEFWLKMFAHDHAPRVLATMTDGQDAALWELTPHRRELGALSPQTLVKSIRDSSNGGAAITAALDDRRT